MNTPVKFELVKLLKEKDEQFDVTSTLDYPTISEVVMWILKKHQLWVNVMYMGFELKYSWSVDVITTSGSNWDSYGERGDIFYYSPIEAYEAAIKYCLTELI
jgi:hypothetical protein